MKNYVISDIHGCYEEYQQLIKSLSLTSKDRVHILGDCIDRGDEPIKVLKDIMNRPNFSLILGNHELMMLEVIAPLLREKTYKTDVIVEWLYNGGKTTIDQFLALEQWEQEEILEFLESAPLYETIKHNGKTFILVHAGLGNYFPEKAMEDYTAGELVWDRADYTRNYFPNTNTYLITGHTPVLATRDDKLPIIYAENNHIAIDCGCSSGGRLCAYCIETGEDFYAQNQIKSGGNYMITSINVNQFLGKNSWTDFQGKEKLKHTIQEKLLKDYYYAYITRHLKDEKDLIVLQEVPYKDIDIYSNKISKIYLALKKFCQENNFEILKAPEKNAYFITLAIFKKGAYEECSNIIENHFNDYRNRIVALQKAENPDELIIGLHIPKNCEKFWNMLISLHENLPKDKKVTYIGDLNTYAPNTINKNKFYEFLSNGIVDLWLENGNSHTKETSNYLTRIDYALITAKDFSEGKYKITIDDAIRLQGYSDHSAIILQTKSHSKMGCRK